VHGKAAQAQPEQQAGQRDVTGHFAADTDQVALANSQGVCQLT
jgi:hypothetical protein